MSRSHALVIPGVNERDVDLLLLEEFLSSPEFGNWFVAQVLPGLDAKECMDARRSVTQANGESDVEVDFRIADGRCLRVLVENKVGAGLQPQQAERYYARGEHYRSSGHCDLVVSVIVAPARYFAQPESTKGFDRRLDYEAIRDWFGDARFLGARRNYKKALLSAAIDKGTLGYQPVADNAVTGFWHGYWVLAREIAPELEMREPLNKPGRSGFIRMGAPALGQIGVSLLHKVKKGKVDLQLAGMGRSVNSLNTQLGALLESGMVIEHATESAAVRLRVPLLSTVESFEGQAKDAAVGILAAKQLMQWAITHKAEIGTALSDAKRK